LKKERKDISSEISSEFPFTYGKANTYYMVNSNIKTIFGVFNNKIIATTLLASLTAFLLFS